MRRFVVSVLMLTGTLAHAEGRREEPVADRVLVVATTNIAGTSSPGSAATACLCT